jgi:SAM-dependent methyltransferase
MNKSEIEGMTQEQVEKYTEAESLIAQWRELGGRASVLLYEARSDIKPDIDWFDHRHHLLNPSVEFVDFWTASGDNVVHKIPIDGTVLDLCCGDGFYDYHFYRHRAKYVLGIDINERAIALAQREHAAQNIEYIVGDVMSYPLRQGYYDVVVCRGAIEHFIESDQLDLFGRIKYALKPGGWFCGDTVAPMNTNDAHKHEWTSENEMRDALAAVFNFIETNVLVSRTRTTLLWRCRA